MIEYTVLNNNTSRIVNNFQSTLHLLINQINVFVIFSILVKNHWKKWRAPSAWIMYKISMVLLIRLQSNIHSSFKATDQFIFLVVHAFIIQPFCIIRPIIQCDSTAIIIHICLASLTYKFYDWNIHNIHQAPVPQWMNSFTVLP